MAGGGYSSHYLRAVDPARPRGAWIRYTAHRRPDQAATGALWCTVWDAEAGPPFAVKQSLAVPPRPTWTGSAEAQGCHAAWELAPAGDEPRLRHLPREWMYRAPLPRTKLESPLPDAVFTGWIETGERPARGDEPGAAARRTVLPGSRGMIGHNWGAEHAERWVWLHAVAFEEAPGAWLDVALGRVRIGRALTPWVANGALAVDGERHRLGGLGRVRGLRVDARPGALEAEIAGAGVRIHATVAAPLDQTVAFTYADPTARGGEHHVLNCSIAQVRLRVERPGRPALELASAHGGAYELGIRETDHGVPLQPFPDP